MMLIDISFHGEQLPVMTGLDEQPDLAYLIHFYLLETFPGETPS
jgi:hypothetical protein